MWKREGKGQGKRGPDDETSYSQGGKGKVKEVKMMEGGSFWGGLGPLLPMVYLDSTVRVLEISIAPTVICQYGMVRCGGERSEEQGRSLITVFGYHTSIHNILRILHT